MEVMRSVLFETNRQKSRTKVPQWNQKQANPRVISSANLLCDTGVKVILVARCWVVQKGLKQTGGLTKRSQNQIT